MNLKPIFHRYLFIASVFLILSGIVSCSNDPVSNQFGGELHNVLVINEGNFSEPDGSITSFDPETGQVVQQIFKQMNGRELLGIIQSISRYGDHLYIVNNVPDKIEIVSAETFESVATVDLDQNSHITPVSFAQVSPSRGYVSSLPNFENDPDNSYVYPIDLESNEPVGERIPVGNSPQQIVPVGNRLYVANSGFGSDNTVTVIDTQSDTVIDTIEVGHGPVRIKKDSQNRLWVVSSGFRPFGEPENNIPGRIDVLDGSNAALINTIETGGFPKAIALDEARGLAWVVNAGAVQQVDMNSYEVNDQAFISRSFNGIGFLPAEDRLYLAHSRGYTQSGQAIIFDMEGAAVDSFQVGIAPMDFLFQLE